MKYKMLSISILTLGLSLGVAPVSAQQQPHTFFTNRIGLSKADIQKMDQGQIVTKVLQSGDPKYGVLVFGGVYVNAPIAKFASTYGDVKGLLQDKMDLDVQELSDPPKLSDFDRLTFSRKDIDELRKCKPDDCDLQVFNIQSFQKQVDWNSSDKYDQANKLARRRAYEGIKEYQAGGLKALGSYTDRDKPFDLYQQMISMVDSSYYLPKGKTGGIYGHVINYPEKKVPGAEDLFYWENIDLGEGPMIRVNHSSIFPKGFGASKLIIANEQLYSSRYIRLALEMFYCVPDTQHPNKPGFYLIEMSDMRVPDFGGLKLGIVKKVATSKGVQGTQNILGLYQEELATK